MSGDKSINRKVETNDESKKQNLTDGRGQTEAKDLGANDNADSKRAGSNIVNDTLLNDPSFTSTVFLQKFTASVKDSQRFVEQTTLPHLTFSDHSELPVSDNLSDGTQTRSDLLLRPDGKYGIGNLGASAEQIARAVRSFDPEIWESKSQTQTQKDHATNLRNMQANLRGGKINDSFLSILNNTESAAQANPEEFLRNLPPDTMNKVNSWLIGESANEIMKQAQIRGDDSRFSKEDNRLLKESALAIRLGHLPSPAEYQENANGLDSIVRSLQSRYPQSDNWTAADHDKVARLVREQESKSDHWSDSYSTATKNGRLACASYITNGKTAKELGNKMPSLDLNMNGAVGESLIRGFQPRSVPEAVQEGKHAPVKDAMAFVIRPALIGNDFKMQENGHIGFLDASKGEVSQNSSRKGIGLRSPIVTDSSFSPSRHPWALVPPGWNQITQTPPIPLRKSSVNST